MGIQGRDPTKPTPLWEYVAVVAGVILFVALLGNGFVRASMLFLELSQPK